MSAHSVGTQPCAPASSLAPCRRRRCLLGSKIYQLRSDLNSGSFQFPHGFEDSAKIVRKTQTNLPSSRSDKPRHQYHGGVPILWPKGWLIVAAISILTDLLYHSIPYCTLYRKLTCLVPDPQPVWLVHDLTTMSETASAILFRACLCLHFWT